MIKADEVITTIRLGIDLRHGNLHECGGLVVANMRAEQLRHETLVLAQAVAENRSTGHCADLRSPRSVSSHVAEPAPVRGAKEND
jgi:hypothetical protein